MLLTQYATNEMQHWSVCDCCVTLQRVYRFPAQLWSKLLTFQLFQLHDYRPKNHLNSSFKTYVAILILITDFSYVSGYHGCRVVKLGCREI